jgi:hypothetical protein
MNAEAGLFGIGGDSWKEDVLLHDGKKLIVERSQTYGGRHEIGQQLKGVSFAFHLEPPRHVAHALN